MTLRRATAPLTAGMVGALLVLGTSTASAIPAATSTTSATATSTNAAAKSPPPELYGKGDPQFDGVLRQSVAMLAQHAAGWRPAPKAVRWLTDQQCGNGAFASYRAEPDTACDDDTKVETNATAAAVQALAALDQDGSKKSSSPVNKALTWLRSVQNKDGGWGFTPGGASDANSTGLVVGALEAADQDAEDVTRNGKSPHDALAKLQLGCFAPRAERGAYAFQPDKKGKLAANDDATTAAVLAGYGEGLLVEPVEDDERHPARALDCGGGKSARPDGERAAEAGAARLARVLRDKGALPSVMPGSEGKPDFANTADAVLALAAGEHADEARRTTSWLAKNIDKWSKAKEDPTALGLLVLAAHAGGADPTSFGGVDLVKRLNATGPQPARADRSEDDEASDDDKDNSSTVWTISLVGAGLAAGIGMGILMSGRRRQL
ncbi:prenyltransferase/squalene oxidase repeat-containing protein [Streptomyces sp. NPDC005438]|uniref:prenyltransferase/squalene oxidase repeat-containing protein n=1 Tax=Streptomyces sp. NPDC005438 TaxID=3156880 RepID=UPI0033AEC61F